MEAFNQTSYAVAPDSTNRTLSVKQAWGLVVLLLLCQLVAAFPYGVIQGIGRQAGFTVNNGVALTLIYAVAFGLTIWRALRKKERHLSFAPINPVLYPVIAVGTVAFGLLLEPLTAALPVPAWLQKILAETFTKDIIWSAVLLAPLLEEILFRGIILDGLLKRYSPVTAILWSAVMFGVVHLNPVQSMGAFALGLPLGWLYYRTGSLWPCILLHFVNNAIGSLVILTVDNPTMGDNTTRTMMGNDGLYGWLLLVCGLVCYGCYQILNRLLPAKTK